MDCVAVELKSNVNWLSSQFHDAADAAAERHNPAKIIGGVPIGSDGWLPREIPPLLQVVVDEVLQQELIHIWQIGMPRDRPDVAGQSPESPLARLYQGHRSWS